MKINGTEIKTCIQKIYEYTVSMVITNTEYKLSEMFPVL